MRTYVACLVAPLLAVAAMNTAADASGIGAASSLAELAAQQEQGDLVVSPLALEHRVWVKTRLARETECADVLVTGSSTVGHFADGMLPGTRLRNVYLGGPTVEDFEALTAMLRRTSCPRRTIVVGVDPWWLGNPALGDRRWMMLVDDYLEYHADASMLRRLDIRAEVAWSRIEERLNFTTTRESAKLLLGRARGATTLGPRLVHDGVEAFCASVTTEHYMRASDGHYVACDAWVKSGAAREEIADRYLRDNQHSMNDWRELAHDRIDRFERLVDEWRRTIGQVVLVGMPFHPTTWRRLREDDRVRRNLDELDARLSRMQKDGVEVMLLRDPAIVGVTGDEFEDSHHISPEGAQKVVRHLSEHTRALAPKHLSQE
jgi:hypothetical protein